MSNPPSNNKRSRVDNDDTQEDDKSNDSVSPPAPSKKTKVAVDYYDEDESVGSEEPTAPGTTTTAEKKGISTYNDKDVLSGRGGGTNLHAVSYSCLRCLSFTRGTNLVFYFHLPRYQGNRFYRELILSHRTTYDEASKSKKPEMSRVIVKKVKDRGGRFLRKERDGLYYEISDNEARAKTSQALRHRTFELRNNKNPDRIKMSGRWKQEQDQIQHPNDIAAETKVRNRCEMKQ
jgi:hypothetical protein